MRILQQVVEVERAVRRAFREIPRRRQLRGGGFGVAAEAVGVPRHRAIEDDLRVRSRRPSRTRLPRAPPLSFRRSARGACAAAARSGSALPPGLRSGTAAARSAMRLPGLNSASCVSKNVPVAPSARYCVKKPSGCVLFVELGEIGHAVAVRSSPRRQVFGRILRLPRRRACRRLSLSSPAAPLDRRITKASDAPARSGHAYIVAPVM